MRLFEARRRGVWNDGSGGEHDRCTRVSFLYDD
jgi:hypothetical protein